MKRFISFSGGVESTTACILYGKGATAITADTGSEQKALYKRIVEVVRYCYKLHGGDIDDIQLDGTDHQMNCIHCNLDYYDEDYCDEDGDYFI